VAVLALPVSASATVRHAAPGGATTGDCTATACDFPTAVASAQDGDDVAVAPGDYGSEASPIAGASSVKAIHVHGAAGRPRPRIFSAPAAPDYWALDVDNYSGSVAHLELTAVGSQSGAVALGLDGAKADDVVAENKVPFGSGACQSQYGATITNSVCWVPAMENAPSAIRLRALTASLTVTLRNVTAVGLGSGTSALGIETNPGQTGTANAVNSIIEGTSAVEYWEASPGDGTARFNPIYSSIVGGDYSFCTPTTDCTQAPSSTNLAARPVFVDLAGNYHQDPMSPTVNRGLEAVANGARDFDGQPRRFGGRTDIGADELVLPPFASTGPATPIKRRVATLRGKANTRNVAKTQAYFELGRTRAYGLTTSDKPLAQNTAGQNVIASPGGLKPGTRYHYRLVVTGPGGVGSGADRTFVTKP
jgi:hypothetical protein